ncbi:MAG: AAA family ATPase [Egibacteraceae bacterium]
MSATPTCHIGPLGLSGVLAARPEQATRDRRGFVAVLGPPAVGKSTVSEALADRLGGRVFRLREFAYDYRSQPGVDERLFDTTDALGWFGEQTVAVLLDAAFLHAQFSAPDLIVLENLPGSLPQLQLVDRLARSLGAALAVVELTAPDSAVAARARTRRVCLTCEPDPRRDPHRPASPSTHNPDQCGHCGGQLRRRHGDHPHLFAIRLERFRSRIPTIRREAAALQLPYQAVDATCDPSTCLKHTEAALAAAVT